MTKIVNKKIIQEAIKAELDKELLSEAPMGVFDAPSRAVGAVGNMFANIGGQMKLGAINKQLDRTAQRIEVDWKKAEDIATKLATKMQSSRNPNIKNSGAQAAKNIGSAGADIRNATGKLRSIAGQGADKGNTTEAGEDNDPNFQTKMKKDEYGLDYMETPVERWVNSFGGNYQDLGKTKRNHMNQLFMELRSAGIDPFAVPKDKQALLAHYAMHRNSQIAATGQDPFPDFEHFEKVLGKKVADDIRKKSQAGQTQPAAPAAPVDNAQQISPALMAYVNKARNFAKKQGVNPQMMDKWLADKLEKIKNVPDLTEDDKDFINRLILKGGGQPTNAFGGGNFNQPPPAPATPPPAPPKPPQQGPAQVNPHQNNNQVAPIPLTQKKGQLPVPPPMPPQQQAQKASVAQMKPQAAQAQQAVRATPIKAIGNPPPPMDLPKQEIGEPVQLQPKLADFFGGQTEPMDPKQLPVPHSQKELDLQDLMKNPGKWAEFKKKHPKSPQEERKQKELSLKSLLPTPPPMEDMGDEVQVGNVDQPAFQPPPADAKPTPAPKKKVSARKKKR